jgi:hypothetical protein
LLSLTALIIPFLRNAACTCFVGFIIFVRHSHQHDVVKKRVCGRPLVGSTEATNGL